MKKTRILISLVLAVLMVGMLAACQPAAQAPASEAPASEAPASEAPVSEAPAPESEAPASEEPSAPAEEKQFKFGIIAHDRAIEWVNYGVMNFEWACEQLGVEPVVVDAQNNMEKVLAGMEDLLAKQVDAVSVYSFSPDLDKRVSQMARDAGIPIVFDNAMPADDVDRDSVTVCRYYDIGYAVAEYISEKYPKANFVYVMGQPGMNITEPYVEGINDALAAIGENAAVMVDTQPTNWTAEEAMNVTQNVLQSGKQIDVIFANNEQIATGVIGALKDAGKFGEIPIIATGGSDLGVELIQSGDLDATMSAPVSFQGVCTAAKLWKLVHGESVEAVSNVPLLPITKENLDENIGWNPSQKVVDAVGGLGN